MGTDGGVDAPFALVAEFVRNKGPWRGIDDLELAVAEYIDWCNHCRLHGEIGLIPLVEHETDHDTALPSPAAAERVITASTKPGT